jgi:hypothetical protein
MSGSFEGILNFAFREWVGAFVVGDSIIGESVVVLIVGTIGGTGPVIFVSILNITLVVAADGC